MLTTSGELLCLSEEDFQKVKTNRRKKVEPEPIVVREDSIAASSIIQYQKCTANASDILKDDTQDLNENGAVWMQNYCDYESASESHMDKTEFTKTELVKQTYDFQDEAANMQIMHSDILYNDDSLYNVGSINEYMDVNYEDFVVKKSEEEEQQQQVELEQQNCNKEFDDRYSECIKNLEAQNENGILYMENNGELVKKEIEMEEQVQCEQEGEFL